MELNELFGIPAHPLIVHAAVVLLPLAAIATVVCAAVPRARRPYAPIAFGVALIATFAVYLAQGSGEELEERVDETELVEEHTEHAEQVLPWAIALTVVSAGVAAIPALERRRPNMNPRTITAVAVVASLIVAAGATYTVIEVGHSGAKATWDDVESEDEG